MVYRVPKGNDSSFRPTPAKAGSEPESSAGKGTGNFFKDEKVASPQLDARPSASLRTCFRGKDGWGASDKRSLHSEEGSGRKSGEIYRGNPVCSGTPSIRFRF